MFFVISKFAVERVDCTNIISEKTIALVSKHLVNGEPIFRFLGLTQITDVLANGIMNVINLFGYNKIK